MNILSFDYLKIIIFVNFATTVMSGSDSLFNLLCMMCEYKLHIIHLVNIKKQKNVNSTITSGNECNSKAGTWSSLENTPDPLSPVRYNIYLPLHVPHYLRSQGMGDIPPVIVQSMSFY